MHGVTGEDGVRGGEASRWRVRGGVMALGAGAAAAARGDLAALGDLATMLWPAVLLLDRRPSPDCIGT